MCCGFAAAGAGHRPENSDKETTSLGTPLLPTSDGSKCPAHFREKGPETACPPSRLLDRSASAPSVCSHEGGRAVSLHPRAAKSVDSLPECSITLENHGPPLPPPNLPDRVASAHASDASAESTGAGPCPGPAVLSPNAFGKPLACVGLHKSMPEDNHLEMEPPVEAGGRGTDSARGPAQERDPPLLSQHAEWNQAHELHLDPKACDSGQEHALGEHCEPSGRGNWSPAAGLSQAAHAKWGFDDLLSGGGRPVEGEMGVSFGEGRMPEGVPHRCPGGDTFMDVDVTKEALPVATDPSTNPDAALADAVDSGGAVTKAPSSLPTGPTPASDLRQPGRPAAQSAESPTAAMPAVPPGGQPSDRAEDPCVSLSSALKELHQLLVVSSKQDFRVAQHEDGLQAAAAPTEHAAISQEEREQTCPDSQGLRLSLPGWGGVEASAGAPSSEAATESSGARGMAHLAVRCRQNTLVIHESSELSRSVLLSSSAASDQLQCGERPEILSQHSSSGQALGGEASGQTQPPISRLAQGPVAPGVVAEEPGVPGASDADAQRLPHGGPAEAPSLLPAGSPDPAAAPRPAAFPPRAIDAIVRAGFTPQEAGEALEQAGGNADLALLFLLAKNIVVPT
ncbi:protein DDI1 homolog 2 isoform X1 [Varanus komodoensis]|uniref:protein DDI1 homolog 2 isoform X1 n=1 Tax=Varanus komodoensis TaxID=61221 RepID=UPI001CF77D87|nr:protein DDI1 homolog 2 isoform X1 [Varanus komodoensis]